MKFLKIAFIFSCVLSAVLSRKSHSKSRNISPASFKSSIECSAPKDCTSICTNFRIVAKNINCYENNCIDKKCVCAPVAGQAVITPQDKCQYAGASSIVNHEIKKTKRRRRY